MPDAIDQAITNTAPTPPVPLTCQLSTGRAVILLAPSDLTDAEVVEVLAAISTQGRAIWAQNRAVATAPIAGRLFVPGRTPVREVVAK